MNRRRFLGLAAMGTVATTGANTWSAPLVSETAGADSGYRLASPRALLTLNRVLHGKAPEFTREFLLADLRPTAERRFTEYSGDLSGRYIGALATTAGAYGWDIHGVQAGILDELLSDALALQKAEGYFGAGFNTQKPGDNDMALLWGNGRLLVGLMEYYAWKPRPEVLAAAKLLGDFLVKIGPMMLSREMRDAFGAQHFASSYICWMQQTEGLALLYRATKVERYRTLAEQVASVIERRPSDHVHGYLTSLRGVMVLFAETGDAALLAQCESAWSEIAASTDLLITGGVPEGWSPNNHRTEGCAECDWVRLNLALWQATSNAKYAAMAERAMLNELAFNQFQTGDFGHRVYTGTGLPAAGAVRAWWCCTLHGMRCFPAMAQSAFQLKGDRVRFDFPIDGFIQTPQFAAVSESRLEEEGVVQIRILRAQEGKMALAFRKPEWASQVNVKVEVQGLLMREDREYVVVERCWQAGDILEVHYGMEMRSEKDGDRTSYRYGPWLLGAPASVNSNYFNELTTQNRLQRVTHRAATSLSQNFNVPAAAATFCCVQAEFPDQPQQVELRAIAEQTGQAPTSWELRFLT